jgi:cell division protein FtsI/penicillin-binding protein 2
MKTVKLAAFAASIAMTAAAASCSSSSVGQADISGTSATESTTAPDTTDAGADTAETSTQPATAAAAAKGSFYDAKGRLLLSTGEDGKRRVSAEPYAVSFANIITPMSDGYDTAFDDILTTPVGDGSGQSIKLTLDGDVQNEIYSYMEQNNIVGAVVCLRTDGSIMAQVSYPSYDPNAVEDQSYNEDLAWGDVGNKAFSNYEPGSCFKIMSEVIADKHGIYSQYDDGTWDFGNDHPIVNWDHETNKSSYPIPNRSLSSAFINSSNIFFAKTFEQVGTADVISDLKTIFHFGADDEDDIHCDFGDLSNNIEAEDVDDLRRSAFGQAKVLTCPIFLAALGREAVFGDMVTPFVVKELVSSDGTQKTGEGSAANDIIASIPEGCRDNLVSFMGSVGSDIGVYVPGYSFYAKTGTAEGWKGDFLYITGCAKNSADNGTQTWENYDSYGDTGSYIVVMEIQNPADHGFEFASQSAGVYRGIMNIVIGR